MSSAPGSGAASTSGNVLPNLSQTPQAPNGISTVENGRIYSLDVVQQPIRARMCGFGDKDRRPITPPPCVRLIIRDEATLKEIDINEIDMSFFVLSVDLWSAEGTREVNLVRHSATSPSISAATSAAYPPPPPQTPVQYPYPPAQPQHQYQNTFGQPIPNHHNPYPPPPQQGGYYTTSQGGPMAPTGYYAVPPPQVTQPSAPSGMFTRNLIGSLSASAFRLTDPDNKIGVWFILQDLSVRTEGTFRLKMNFVNVGDGPSLNTGSAPILASTFSDIFQVFSAKKFPGVIESTNLSKCFATQGIKIPIRKDGPKALSNQAEYDNDD
ncbi:MAG: Velvet complex subunit ryp3 [Pycnora praestabilis]|nr:MAG: Velvet complex subunit ryp3 [Pycnora praestabilis]